MNIKKRFSIEIFSRNGDLVEFAYVYCKNPKLTRIYKSMLINKPFDCSIKIHELIKRDNKSYNEYIKENI